MKNSYLLFVCFLALSLYVDSQVMPKIKWTFDLLDSSFGQSAAADIDNDGKLEIVFGCYRNDSCIYALNAEDGTLLWKFNAASSNAEGCNDTAPIIFDVDGDNTLDVIVPGSCNPKTFCLDGKSGTVKWVCNTRGSDSPPTIADIDNDGETEILHGEFGGYVICINAKSGTQKWEICVNSNSWVQTAPSLTYADEDNFLDFIVGTWHFDHKDSLYAFSGKNHSMIWSIPIHDYMYHGTAIADIDKNGKDELLVGAYNDTVYCINSSNGGIKWVYKGPGYVGAPISIGDLDNDGESEIIAVSYYAVLALNNKGKLKWQYDIPGYEQAFRGVVLSDINNDIFPDVVFGTNGGKLIALNGLNGTELFNLNLKNQSDKEEFGFDNSPLIADFDNDGLLEAFIIGGYTKYPDFSKNYGRAYMLDLGKGNGPPWLMFQNNLFRTSSIIESNNDVKPNIAMNSKNNMILIESRDLINLIENYLEKSNEVIIYNYLGKEILRLNNTNQIESNFNKLLSDHIYYILTINGLKRQFFELLFIKD